MSYVKFQENLSNKIYSENMDDIFFPSHYKKAILHKTKNTTIRIGKEIGKYKTGKIYLAKSYAGNNWGVKIKVNSVIKNKLRQLSEHGIPERSIEATQRKEKYLLMKLLKLSNLQ